MENNFYGAGMYGYGAGYPQPMPGYYNYPAYMMQPGPQPQNSNALTPDEIKVLRNARPTSKINLNIDQDEYLRALCTHKEPQNGNDVVYQINDGTNEVFCPICQERWNPEKATKEEITDMVNHFVSHIQNMKWIGDMPVEVVREYCAIIPLIRKFPDLYEYAVNNFNKFAGNSQYYNASEAAIYSQYNALMGGGFNAYMQPGMYQPQPMQQMPQGYYAQQPVMGMGANPSVNPMQAQPGMMPGVMQPQMGWQGAPMMGQQQMAPGYYGQPPVMGQPAPQQQVQQGPAPYVPGGMVFSPAAQGQQQQQQSTQQPPKTETKEETVNL